MMVNTLTAAAYLPDSKLIFFTHPNHLFLAFCLTTGNFCLVASLRLDKAWNLRSLDPFYKLGKMDG